MNKTEKQQLIKEQNRVPRWVMPLVKFGIIIFDALLAFACFVIAFSFRQSEPILSETAWAWSKEFVPYAGVIYFIIVIRVLMLAYQRVYRLQGAFSYIAEFIKVFKAVLVGSLLTIAFTFLFRGGFAFREFSYSRGVFVLDFLIALVVFSLFHIGLRYLQTVVRNRDINLIPTLIIGTNTEAIQTINELKERRDLGYRIVGIVKNNFNHRDTEMQRENDVFKKVPIIGAFDDLPDIIHELEIQEVIITDSKIPSEKLFESMMQIGRERKVEFRLAPSLFNFLPQKTSVEQIGVLPMVRLFREPLSDVERFIKRLSDIVISSIAIAIISPFWLILSVIIKLDSKGAIFFKQERVGMDGRKFLCYKFRSMKSDADEAIHRESYRKNIEGKLSEANSGDKGKPVFGKVKDDPRITKIGKFLRRSSLDETPQLLNVLKGEMSVIGPRPPIPYEVEEYELWHRKRLDMKPGITGLWQVSGRNRLTFEEMVKIDLFYIENWSLWLDLKIILLTLPAILRGDGEE